MKPGRIRFLAFVATLTTLGGIWLVAAMEMRLLRPTLDRRRDLIVAACRQLFDDYSQGKEKYDVSATTSVRREFSLFGVPRGTVALTAHFVDVRGQEQVVTGHYHHRRRADRWLPETVSGTDVLELVGYNMKLKYPSRARELRLQMLLGPTGYERWKASEIKGPSMPE